MPFKEWPQEEIRTRYGILNMMLTPKKCHPLAYSDISAVNTFRLIKACIFDKAPDFLPDLNFFATSYGDKIMPLSGNND